MSLSLFYSGPKENTANVLNSKTTPIVEERGRDRNNKTLTK